MPADTLLCDLDHKLAGFFLIRLSKVDQSEHRDLFYDCAILRGDMHDDR